LTRPEPDQNEPDWLLWAREIQATAQTGLAFSKDPYDHERYRSLTRLAARILESRSGTLSHRIESLFTDQYGYATPKVGVRGAVFDENGRILMVQEREDNDRWTLPGGWAEVNQTPAESAAREVFEESGYRVRPVKLAAVWDRSRQKHPPGLWSVARMFFICVLEGGEASTSLETSGVGWFAEDALPVDLSLGRVQPRHIERMFAHWRDPNLPTEFD